MRILIPFGIVLATTLVACSSPPGSTVLVVGATPIGGDFPGLVINSADSGKAAVPESTIVFMPATEGGPSVVLPEAGPILPRPRDDAGAVQTLKDAASSMTPGDGSAGGGAGTGVPCDVATYLALKCVSCHGNPPIPGALAALVTYADMMAVSKEDPTKNEAELSLARMKNAALPMPPGALPTAAEVAILDNWIKAGYPQGSCGGVNGGEGGVPVAPPPPPSVFKGAVAFAPRNGSNSHNAGRDCMSCHRNGGDEAPRFALGGTLYDGAGKAVGGAEVRLLDANGKATSVYTGTNGTFFINGTGFVAPAWVGVRNATIVRDMITTLQASNGGACSSCHCTGATCTVPTVHLP